MRELKEVLAENLRELRKKHSLTQIELAEQLHYSDKSVSKWEHGDALPDIEVIARIAAFYGVTVDYLLNAHSPEEEVPTNAAAPQRKLNGNKLIITLLAVSAVWILSTIVYTQLLIWADVNYWCVFVWSVPASCVVLIVFNAIWGKRRFSFWLTSFLVWTLITALYIQTLQYNMWTLYFIGVPLQISVLLWAKLKKNNGSDGTAK